LSKVLEFIKKKKKYYVYSTHICLIYFRKSWERESMGSNHTYGWRDFCSIRNKRNEKCISR